MKANQLRLCREIIGVYSEIRTKHICILWHGLEFCILNLEAQRVIVGLEVINNTGAVRINVTLKRVHVTILAVEKQ
jgi:hypothetical protein